MVVDGELFPVFGLCVVAAVGLVIDDLDGVVRDVGEIDDAGNSDALAIDVERERHEFFDVQFSWEAVGECRDAFFVLVRRCDERVLGEVDDRLRRAVVLFEFDPFDFVDRERSPVGVAVQLSGELVEPRFELGGSQVF